MTQGLGLHDFVGRTTRLFTFYDRPGVKKPYFYPVN